MILTTPTGNPAAQGGAALVVALVLLVVVTLMGISSMTMSNYDTVMAVNTQATVAALSEAENGLVDGEGFISTNFPSVPTFDWSAASDDGLYMTGDLGGTPADVVDWESETGAYESATGGGRYVIEYLGVFSPAGASLTLGAGTPTEQRYLYLITSRGDAGKGGVRFVQSVFATSP